MFVSYLNTFWKSLGYISTNSWRLFSSRQLHQKGSCQLLVSTDPAIYMLISIMYSGLTMQYTRPNIHLLSPDLFITTQFCYKICFFPVRRHVSYKKLFPVTSQDLSLISNFDFFSKKKIKKSRGLQKLRKKSQFTLFKAFAYSKRMINCVLLHENNVKSYESKFFFVV